MNQLSSKELMFVEDEIRSEEITAKTLNWCASQCDDQQIRSKLEEIAERHQLKVADLSQYFNQTSNIQ